MLGRRIESVMKSRNLLTAAPSTTVAKAAQRMARRGVGAMLVVKDRALVGIFTERDATFRVIAAGKDPATTKLADVMTPDPLTIGPQETFGRALLIMQQKGFRHLPVVRDGRAIGIVSSRSAMDPDLVEFRCEAERREGYASR